MFCVEICTHLFACVVLYAICTVDHRAQIHCGFLHLSLILSFLSSENDRQNNPNLTTVCYHSSCNLIFRIGLLCCSEFFLNELHPFPLHSSFCGHFERIQICVEIFSNWNCFLLCFCSHMQTSGLPLSNLSS